MPVTINGSTGVTFPNSTLQASAAPGGGTTTSSAVDVTLTNTSSQVQNITMTAANKFVILPNATTLQKGGVLFKIYNNGGIPFGVKNASGRIIIPLLANGTSTILYLTNNSTSDGIWASDRGIYSIASTPFVDSTVSSTEVCAAALTSTSFIFVSGVGNTLSATVGTWNGTTITYGASTTLTTSAPFDTTQVGVIGFSGTSAAVKYRHTDTTLRIVGLSISGTTITAGTAQTIQTGSGYTGSSFIKINSTTGLAVYNPADQINVYARAFTISGTTITLGSQTKANSQNSEYGFGVLVDTNKVLFAFQEVASYPPIDIEWRVATISGTTFTFGTAVKTANVNLGQSTVLFSTTTNEAYTASDGSAGSGYKISISGTVPTPAAYNLPSPQPSYLGYEQQGGSSNISNLSTGKSLVRLSLFEGVGVWNDVSGVGPAGTNYAIPAFAISPKTVVALSSTTGIVGGVSGSVCSFSYLEIA